MVTKFITFSPKNHPLHIHSRWRMIRKRVGLFRKSQRHSITLCWLYIGIHRSIMDKSNRQLRYSRYSASTTLLQVPEAHNHRWPCRPSLSLPQRCGTVYRRWWRLRRHCFSCEKRWRRNSVPTIVRRRASLNATEWISQLTWQRPAVFTKDDH